VPTVIGDKGLGHAPVGMTRFKGQLGDLLAALTRSRNLGFSWHHGVLTITDGVQMIAYLPQNKDLIKAVSQDLKTLGAQHITASANAGTVTFEAPGSQQTVIRDYIKRMVNNAATVSLQVAIVT